jgi:hypothetical protein
MLGGFFMGINAVATQAIRRQLTSNDQFAEIVGLEAILGKLTEFIIASASAWALVKWGVSYELGILVTVVGYWLVAWRQWGAGGKEGQGYPSQFKKNLN